MASLCDNPELLDPEKEPLVSQLYPSDAIARARAITKMVGASIGAYSHTQGVPGIRQTVARFLEERDGHPADYTQIYLCQGASAGIHQILSLVVENEKTGILM